MDGDELRKVIRTRNQALWDTVEGRLRGLALRHPQDESLAEALEAVETLRMGYLVDQEQIEELEDDLLDDEDRKAFDALEARRATRPREYAVFDTALQRAVDNLLDGARASRLGGDDWVVPLKLLTEVRWAMGRMPVYQPAPEETPSVLDHGPGSPEAVEAYEAGSSAWRRKAETFRIELSGRAREARYAFGSGADGAIRQMMEDLELLVQEGGL
jgi:hypothetical protein